MGQIFVCTTVSMMCRMLCPYSLQMFFSHSCCSFSHFCWEMSDTCHVSCLQFKPLEELGCVSQQLQQLWEVTRLL